MKALGSVAAVVAATLEDADAEVDAIDREAAAAIAALPRGDGAADRPEDTAAIAAARERARIAIAHEDWEDARAAIGEREAWLTRALEIGRRRLAMPEAPALRRDRLALLAREAIERLPAGPIEIVVAEADVPLLDADWRSTLAPNDPAQIAIVAGPIDGGLLARTRDGRAVFDNTWTARAERLQSIWRAALADVYDRTTAMLTRAIEA